VASFKVLIARLCLLPEYALTYFLRRIFKRIVSSNWFGMRVFRRMLSTDSFGMLEVIIYSWRRIDYWERYSSVARQVKTLDVKGLSILDVGGSTGNISEFLGFDCYDLCILNIDAQVLRTVADSRLQVVAGDGCRLPFKGDSFDVIVSVDCLEHIPGSKKEDFCQELQRVAKKYVILHCPADSSDGSFQGSHYDRKFLQAYQRIFGKPEPSTLDHVTRGLPRIEELIALFPSSTIVGRQNCKVWLKYMVLGSIPFVKLITGLVYKVFLQRTAHLPPYHACLLVWRKS
jgi:ubiquinone/menaquinone biosynthesis C-methylase UbiE